jgi:hypothetical protein
LFFKNKFVAAQPVDEALGVIQPVHGKDHLLPDAFLAQFLHPQRRFPSTISRPAKAVEFHAHRKRVHLHHAVAQRQTAEMVFIAGRAQHRGQKIPDIIVRVKTDQAGAEQPLNDFLAPRRGSMRKISQDGNGMCRKNPMGISGNFSRTSFGSSIRW